MKYKLAAADLDGTLLDRSSKITDASVAAVKAAEKAGLIFTICTGRAQSTVVMGYIERLGLSCPVITYNGAMLIKPDGEIIFRRDLENEDAVKAYEAGAERGTDMIVWSDNRLYFSKLTPETAFYRSFYPHAELTVIDSPNEIYDIVRHGITKIIYVSSPELTDDNQRFVDEQFAGRVVGFRSSPNYIEIVHKDVSKGDALLQLAGYYGIPREQTVAFGDEKNDIPMIKAAGLGVAMANAVPELLAVADYVTLSNAEDGVADALYKMINGEI
ncbi:MAG: HAD family phosphatase [Clostridia bacterium]|nr:HAD family phosphatase [Clostridia bacterium]MBR5769172.1 HAD family phosphatase [Clostridia bacterium]